MKRTLKRIAIRVGCGAGCLTVIITLIVLFVVLTPKPQQRIDDMTSKPHVVRGIKYNWYEDSDKGEVFSVEVLIGSPIQPFIIKSENLQFEKYCSLRSGDIIKFKANEKPIPGVSGPRPEYQFMSIRSIKHGHWPK